MKYELNNYYNEDCLQAMKTFPDNYFDLAIVDPPYGLGNKVVNSGGRFEKYKTANGNWDNKTPNKNYFKELMRVSKNQIIWGGNYFELPPTRGFAIWDKKRPKGFSLASCEFAWTSFDSIAKTFYHLPNQEKNRFHPTQKPVDLYEWLLNNYATAGDKILDTHVGSASSLIACYNLGFDFIGFELDEEYYQKSKERLEARMNQMDLFHMEES